MFKYLIQFMYGIKTYSFSTESSCDLSEETTADKNLVVNLIDVYIKENALNKKGKKVHDVILFDEKGTPLWAIEDLSNLYSK